MAAEIQFTPLTDRGRKLLDELEAAMGAISTEGDDGTRTYVVFLRPDAGTDAFDPVLDRLEPGWRDVHLTRTPKQALPGWGPVVRSSVDDSPEAQAKRDAEVVVLRAAAWPKGVEFTDTLGPRRGEAEPTAVAPLEKRTVRPFHNDEELWARYQSALAHVCAESDVVHFISEGEDSLGYMYEGAPDGLLGWAVDVQRWKPVGKFKHLVNEPPERCWAVRDDFAATPGDGFDRHFRRRRGRWFKPWEALAASRQGNVGSPPPPVLRWS